MITLYHCRDARSFRVLWALEELGVPYELVLLPFPPRAFAREYLEINPLGTVPLLIDGATRMTESAGICQYLAAKNAPNPLDVGREDAAFGAYIDWIHFGEATLTFPQTLVLRYSRLEPEERRNPSVVKDYSRWFLARLRAVDSATARNEYLCAGRFTVADISVGYALLLAAELGLDEQFGAATSAYWRRLQVRDGFLRAKAAQGHENQPGRAPAATEAETIGSGLP